jgi:hypothetical protein
MAQNGDGQVGSSTTSSASGLILRVAQMQLEETVKLACYLSKQRHNRLSKLFASQTVQTVQTTYSPDSVKPTLTVKDLGFAAKKRGLDVLVFDRTASYERKIFDSNKDNDDRSVHLLHFDRVAAVKKEMERIDEVAEAVNSDSKITSGKKLKKKKQRVEL